MEVIAVGIWVPFLLYLLRIIDCACRHRAQNPAQSSGKLQKCHAEVTVSPQNFHISKSNSTVIYFKSEVVLRVSALVTELRCVCIISELRTHIAFTYMSSSSCACVTLCSSCYFLLPAFSFLDTIQIFSSPKDIAGWVSVHAILTKLIILLLLEQRCFYSPVLKEMWGIEQCWFLLLMKSCAVGLLCYFLIRDKSECILDFSSLLVQNKICFSLVSPAAFLPLLQFWRRHLMQLFRSFNLIFVLVSRVPAGPLLCFQLVGFLILRLTWLTDKTEWWNISTALKQTIWSLQKHYLVNVSPRSVSCLSAGGFVPKGLPKYLSYFGIFYQFLSDLATFRRCTYIWKHILEAFSTVEVFCLEIGW